MSAIPAAAHTRLVLLRRAYDTAVSVQAGLAAGERYRDAVTMAALMSGQAYEDIDAAIRTENPDYVDPWATTDRDQAEADELAAYQAAKENRS